MSEPVKVLYEIVKAADALEAYMHSHVGPANDADWPINLACDNQQSASEITGLLQGLTVALKPYRAAIKRINGIEN
jgi:hypothetical protein